MTGTQKPCNRCQYRGAFGTGLIPESSERFFCDHIGWTGKMRGCEPGPGCTAFKEASKKRNLRDLDKYPLDFTAGDFKEV